MTRAIDSVSSANHAAKIIYSDENVRLGFVLPNFVDVPAVSAAVRESRRDLARFFPFAHYGDPADLDRQDERARECLADFFAGKQVEYWVFRGPEHHFVSCCTLFPDGESACEGLEIGYWVNTAEANRGLGTLINQIISVYVFVALGMDRLQAPCNVNNKKSRYIYEKLGFSCEGVLRGVDEAEVPQDSGFDYEAGPDSAIYALVKGDVPRLPWFSAVAGRMTVVSLSGAETSVECD